MTRKRCNRRPVPVRSVPIVFGFPADMKTKAMIQARAALAGVLGHTGDADDVQVLLRIAMYCSGMCEQLLRDDTVDAEGLADAIEAVNAALAAVTSVADRLKRSGKVGTAGPEREPLERLVDAYEALFSLGTRRESTAVLDALPDRCRVIA